MLEDMDREKLLKNFDKYTAGKSCVYINKLEDIDVDILRELIQLSLRLLKERYSDQ